MFEKIKKHVSLNSKSEIDAEQQKLNEEAQRKEQLKKQIEEAEKMAAEAMVNNTPYRFSVPDPMPKELVSVLKEMFKKLFPDAKKAYLVYTQYEEKAGYLLVVDIDAKFHKIINLYLDGETKKVRNGLPIECILYSKSGALTEGMEPFYQKEIIDANSVSGSFVDLAALGISSDFSFDDVLDFDTSIINDDTSDSQEQSDEELPHGEEVASEEDVNSDEETVSQEPSSDEESDLAEPDSSSESTSEENVTLSDETEVEFEDEEKPIELTVEETTVKVKPETKQQLFALMNRMSKKDSEEVQSIAIAGFGEFEFYIPYTSEEASDEAFEISASCPLNARHFPLVNRDTGIKATVLFTDEENAVNFAKTHNCQLAKMRYFDYKEALNEGTIISPSTEGVIINPDVEQVLLPTDYPLL